MILIELVVSLTRTSCFLRFPRDCISKHFTPEACTTCALREISCSEASFSREEMFSTSLDAVNAIGRNPILSLSNGVIFVNLLKMMSRPSLQLYWSFHFFNGLQLCLFVRREARCPE